MKTLTHTTTLISKPFVFICISSLLFSSSYNMLIPELPSYLAQMGGGEWKGLIIALFTLTAGLSRPFSGKLADTIGRKPVMLFGAFVCIGISSLYPVISSIAGFLFLRLVHGFSTGFTPTGLSAYIADSIPKARWGEALGIQGLFYSTGLALGPAVGSLIKANYSFDIMFYSSSAIALLALILMQQVPETLQKSGQFSWNSLKITKSDVIAKEVLPAGIITFLYYLPFGVVLTLIPDWSETVGISNKGAFFIYFTLASLAVRFFAGKYSDTYGRIPLIKVGLLLMGIALLLLGSMHSATGVYLSATLYGLAMGILSPAANAWTIDLSNDHERGKAMATMYIALEAGIGLGALCSGAYVQNHIQRTPVSILIAAALVFSGIVYLTLRRSKK